MEKDFMIALLSTLGLVFRGYDTFWTDTDGMVSEPGQV